MPPNIQSLLKKIVLVVSVFLLPTSVWAHPTVRVYPEVFNLKQGGKFGRDMLVSVVQGTWKSELQGGTVLVELPAAGEYQVTFNPLPGYRYEASAECSGTIGEEEHIQCNVKYYDDAPQDTTPLPPSPIPGSTQSQSQNTLVSSQTVRVFPTTHHQHRNEKKEYNAKDIWTRIEQGAWYDQQLGVPTYKLPSPGEYKVTFFPPPGYRYEATGDCAGTIEAGAHLQCNVEYWDDVPIDTTPPPPPPPPPPILPVPISNPVVKVVFRGLVTHGGNYSAVDIKTVIEQGGWFNSKYGAATYVLPNAGEYKISVFPPPGYSAETNPSMSTSECSGIVGVNEQKLCVIAYRDTELLETTSTSQPYQSIQPVEPVKLPVYDPIPVTEAPDYVPPPPVDPVPSIEASKPTIIIPTPVVTPAVPPVVPKSEQKMEKKSDTPKPTSKDAPSQEKTVQGTQAAIATSTTELKENNGIFDNAIQRVKNTIKKVWLFFSGGLGKK